MVTDLSLSSSILIEQLIAAGGERAILSMTDAPDEELRNVQAKVDQLSQELMRRMSW